MSLTPFARHAGCRVSDALTYQGQPLIWMENEQVALSILPHKGAEFFDLAYKPLDLHPLARFRTAVAPAVYPATVASSDGAFLDHYTGGWQVMFPNAGGPASVMGAELGRHGEAALLPWSWQIVEDRPEQVTVRLWAQTRRTPFLIRRSVSLGAGETSFLIEESITNTGGVEWPYRWGHHPAFGAPFLSSRCVLDVPARRVESHWRAPVSAARLPSEAAGAWPLMRDRNGQEVDLRRIPAPGSGSADMFYLLDLQAGWYALTNQELGAGFALLWDVHVFPVLWVWQEFGGSRESPWFSSAYILGLEPCSGYATQGGDGINLAMENGWRQTLQPGETKTTQLRAILYQAPGVQGVKDIQEGGRRITFVETAGQDG